MITHKDRMERGNAEISSWFVYSRFCIVYTSLFANWNALKSWNRVRFPRFISLSLSPPPLLSLCVFRYFRRVFHPVTCRTVSVGEVGHTGIREHWESAEFKSDLERITRVTVSCDSAGADPGLSLPR